jgi:hypothetical protein
VYRLRPFESLPAAHRNNTKAFALVLAIVRRGIRSQVTNYFLALRENNKYLRPRLGDKHPSLSRFRCEKCGLLCSATHCFVLQWLCRESEGSCIPPPAFESLPTLQTATTPVHTDVGWAVCAPGIRPCLLIHFVYEKAGRGSATSILLFLGVCSNVSSFIFVMTMCLQ